MYKLQPRMQPTACSQYKLLSTASYNFLKNTNTYLCECDQQFESKTAKNFIIMINNSERSQAACNSISQQITLIRNCPHNQHATVAAIQWNSHTEQLLQHHNDNPANPD